MSDQASVNKVVCPQCRKIHVLAPVELAGSSICECGFALVENGVLKTKPVPEDVTDKVDFAEIDGESLPLTKCVCGAKFSAWQEVVSIYPEHPWECPQCRAKLIFSCAIRVYKVP